METSKIYLSALNYNQLATYGSERAITVDFMSLAGSFHRVERKQFKSLKEAFEAVKKYAATAGFTDVKMVKDPNYIDRDDIRFTAKTPGGRAGRNIAFAHYDISDEDIYTDEDTEEEEMEERLEQYPILHSFVSKGLIKEDNGEYIGTASDDTEVNIGNVGEEARVEDYLKSHPTPDTW